MMMKQVYKIRDGGITAMKTEMLQVKGMSCQHCVQAVEKALRDIGASGRVDLSSGSVTVEYDETNVTLQAIKDAIEDQGYEVVS
jgi:copper chaperone